MATNKPMVFPAIAICNVNQVDCNQTYHYISSDCHASEGCPLEQVCRLFDLARCDIVMSYMDDAAAGMLGYEGVDHHCGEPGPLQKVPSIQTQAEAILATLPDEVRMAIGQDRTKFIRQCYFMGTAFHPACINLRKGLQVTQP